MNHLNEIKFKYNNNNNVIGRKITSSKDAEEFFRQIYDEDQIEAFESFYALYLDEEMNTIAYIKISSGGLTGTVVDIKHVLVGLIKLEAKNLIISHNHPSGALRPSQNDIKLTNKLKKACELLDYNLADHIILTKDSYVSFIDKVLL